MRASAAVVIVSRGTEVVVIVAAVVALPRSLHWRCVHLRHYHRRPTARSSPSRRVAVGAAMDGDAACFVSSLQRVLD